jgi:hypothetical protein
MTGRQSQYDLTLRGIDYSFATPACRDMSLGAKELNWVESSELARKELDSEKKASCVI